MRVCDLLSINSHIIRFNNWEVNEIVRVLFVCLGNICRSPMAEAVLRHKINERELSDKILVESAGTGDWHIGKSRMKEQDVSLIRTTLAMRTC